MDLRTESEGLAVALELGLLTTTEVVAWADAQIEVLERPPLPLLEVALSQESRWVDVASLLRQLPGNLDTSAASRRVLRLILQGLEGGRLAPAQAARALFGLQGADLVPDPSARADMVRLDDAFELALREVWGTVDALTAELRGFLARYAEP